MTACMSHRMPLMPVHPPLASSPLSVSRYDASCKSDWDRFVACAKNATFMFRRDYMDYHADRLEDCSLIVRRGVQIVGVLPASLSRDIVVSHAGLTYGGFVLPRDGNLVTAIEVVHAVLLHLEAQAVKQLVYKRMPSFYNTLPDGEIDYVLFLLEARLTRRDCSLVIAAADRLPVSRGRKSKINKGRRAGLSLVEESGFGPFWHEVLEPRLLERFGVRPVHSVDEIRLLAARLPQNIKQFSAYLDDTIVAGVTIYETPTVAHAQYIATTALGEDSCALDCLFDWLISERYEDKVFFDLGICNEDEGRALNHGLLRFKEGFGGRAAPHDFYTIDTGAHSRLLGVLPRTAA